MLLLRKVHKEKAGPWLGAFGASFVSAGKIQSVKVYGVPLLIQYFQYIQELLFQLCNC
jgi:hypothetical protein